MGNNITGHTTLFCSTTFMHGHARRQQHWENSVTCALGRSFACFACARACIRAGRQVFPAMDEAAMTQLPNGSVLLNMRHQSSPHTGRAVSVSHDGGKRFGVTEYTQASAQCCARDLGSATVRPCCTVNSLWYVLPTYRHDVRPDSVRQNADQPGTHEIEFHPARIRIP